MLFPEVWRKLQSIGKNPLSRKEELEILFPFLRDQEIRSSRKKNAWLINKITHFLVFDPLSHYERSLPISAVGCVYLSIS